MPDEQFEQDVATVVADMEKEGCDEPQKAAIRLGIDALRNLRAIAKAMSN